VKYERYLLKHAQMLPVYAYVVKFQDNDPDLSFIGSLEAPIIIEKDWSGLPCSDKAAHEFHACMQTNETGLRFYKDSLECFV